MDGWKNLYDAGVFGGPQNTVTTFEGSGFLGNEGFFGNQTVLECPRKLVNG